MKQNEGGGGRSVLFKVKEREEDEAQTCSSDDKDKGHKFKEKHNDITAAGSEVNTTPCV